MLAFVGKSLSLFGIGIVVAFLVGAMVHEKEDPLGLFGAHEIDEALAGELEIGAAGDVVQDHPLALGEAEPLDDVVEVHVKADLGTLFVFGLDEGAL